MYTDADLPPLEAPFRHHVHLPLDLPWERPHDAAAAVRALAQWAAPCRPWAFVLHPPPQAEALAPVAAALQEADVPPAAILLENIGEPPLAPVVEEALRLGLGFCLDIPHLLQWDEAVVLSLGEVRQRTRMLHLYAPDLAGPAGNRKHLPLAQLPEAGVAMAREAMAALPLETVTLEVFAMESLLESAALWRNWTTAWEAAG